MCGLFLSVYEKMKALVKERLLLVAGERDNMNLSCGGGGILRFGMKIFNTGSCCRGVYPEIMISAATAVCTRPEKWKVLFVFRGNVSL